MSIRRGWMVATLCVLGAGESVWAGDAVTASASDTNVVNAQSDLGEITVTAQRRTQSSQEVPISLQVVTMEQADVLAAPDLSRMSGYIPGLTVDGEQKTQPGFTLRGISISDFGIGTDSPIGIYEDGVYTGKTGGSLLLFNDMQRVEVLKGPQGTLFGRNSAAGAISLVSNSPEDVWAGEAKVRYGNYGTEYLEAMVNAPINEELAARFSFVDNRSDGWLHDYANGTAYDRDGDWSTRTQLLWRAPADTKVRLIWEHEQLDQPARPAIGILPIPPYPALPGIVSTPPTAAQMGEWISPLHAPLLNDTPDARETRTLDAITLRIEHSFSFGDLASISAYRYFSTFNREDQDGTNRSYLYFDDANIEQNKSFSQEITLSGKNARADWVAGTNFYYDDAYQDSQLNLNTSSIDTLINNTVGLPGGIYGPISAVGTQYGLPSLVGLPWQESMYNEGLYRAEALFGDVIWHLADRWDLTTGIRYTHDEKDFSWYNPTRTAAALDTNLSIYAGAGFPLPPFPYTQNIEFTTPASTAAPLRMHDDWNDLSPRAVLQFKPIEDTMVYASIARGYEAGGFNALAPGSTYDPEHVLNYELGIKSEMLDHRLLVNASVYHYIYSNLQSLNLVTGNAALPEYEVTVSDQNATGVDLESAWKATDALRLTFIAAYIDQTYKDYTAPDGTNLNGQAVGTPLWSLAAGAAYTWRDLFNGDLVFNLQDAYQGAGRCNADSAAQGGCLAVPAFRTVQDQNRTDAHLGWTSSGPGHVSVAFYMNNIFDKQYATGVNNITSSTLGTPFSNITAPRFYGVELGAKF